MTAETACSLFMAIPRIASCYRDSLPWSGLRGNGPTGLATGSGPVQAPPPSAVASGCWGAPVAGVMSPNRRWPRRLARPRQTAAVLARRAASQPRPIAAEWRPHRSCDRLTPVRQKQESPGPESIRLFSETGLQAFRRFLPPDSTPTSNRDGATVSSGCVCPSPCGSHSRSQAQQAAPPLHRCRKSIDLSSCN
jgi:hypothetical protein